MVVVVETKVEGKVMVVTGVVTEDLIVVHGMIEIKAETADTKGTGDMTVIAAMTETGDMIGIAGMTGIVVIEVVLVVVVVVGATRVAIVVVTAVAMIAVALIAIATALKEIVEVEAVSGAHAIVNKNLNVNVMDVIPGVDVRNVQKNQVVLSHAQKVKQRKNKK